jgi:PAS domain S-box-containing protein
MDPRPASWHVTRLETASRWLAVAVAALGGLVLLGWAFEQSPLKTVLPGTVPMYANTALAFVLSAVPLALRRDGEPRRHAIARACAALVALIGLLTVAEYGLGRDLHIDQWLFQDLSGATHPGRMALVAAVGVTLLGLAEVALDHPRMVALGQWLAIAVGFIGVINLVGHVYRLQGLDRLYSPALAYTSMALPTAGALVVAGGAVLCARPDRGMMAIVTSRTAGGVVARRLLPAALGLPLVLGWLRLLGERGGLWTFQAGFVLLALSTLALFTLIAWRSALALHRTDIQRQQVEEALLRARDELETQVQQRTRDLRESERRYRELVDSSRGLICTHDLEGTLLSVNPAAAQLLGYTSAELVGKNLRELLDPAVQEHFSQYLQRIREAPADEGAMRVVTRSGERRLWAYSNVRYEEPGRPPYVLGHAQDITELKRAEHLARQAEALRSVAQLANAAAHEINNPLTVVAGHLDIMKGQSSGNPSTVRRIEKATEAVDRIRAIVESMGRITRLERLDSGPHLPPQLDLRRSAATAAEPPPTPDGDPAAPPT